MLYLKIRILGDMQKKKKMLETVLRLGTMVCLANSTVYSNVCNMQIKQSAWDSVTSIQYLSGQDYIKCEYIKC